MAITIARDLREINDELKQVESQAKSAARESKSLAAALKLDPSSVKLTEAYHKSLETQLTATARKIEILKEKQDALVAANGPDAKLTPQYQKLDTEIAKCQATTTSLETQTKKVSNIDFSKLKSGLATVAKTAAGIAASVMAIGAAFASSADQIQIYIDRFGGTAEAWQYAANQWDKVTGSADAYSSTLSQVLTVQGQISKESSRVGTVLAQLGLSFEDFTGKSATEALSVFIESLKQIGDEAERESIAVSLFGSTVGSYVAQMCEASTESLQEYNDALTAAGVLTSEQVAAGAELQDTFDYLKQSLIALVAEFGESLKPTIETLIDLFRTILPLLSLVADAISAIGPAGTIAVAAFISMMTFLPSLIQMMAALKMATGDIVGAIAAFTALSIATAAGVGIISSAVSGGSSSSSASSAVTGYTASTAVESLASSTSSGSSSSSTSGSSTSSDNVTYQDNSVNTYNINNMADADAVVQEISNKRKMIMGRSRR